jgi:hypothetical protein
LQPWSKLVETGLAPARRFQFKAAGAVGNHTVGTSGYAIKRYALDNRRVLLMLFVAALLFQTGATIGAIVFLQLPISTGWDNEEYIRTADNVLAGHGFSIEDAPPFRPNGFRTPGPLLLNMPLRLLSHNSDIAAALISRMALSLGALLCVLVAVQLSLGKYALLTGSLFILTPTMFYYSMLAYSTELPYAVACGLLEAGTILYLSKASHAGLTLIGLSSLYALYLRPAALFVLIAYTGSCALAAILIKQVLRRRLLIAGTACLLGAGIAYTTWCYRTYIVFHAFEYSTVSGENLLKWNAQGMRPFLDRRGTEELDESLNKYPIKLQRYSGPDQFVLSDQEGKEGLRLIFKYPMAFLRSHLRGASASAFLFCPASLQSRQSSLCIGMSIVHFGFLLFGTVGLILLFPLLNPAQRAALLIIAVVGIVSVLTGGALYSPRFRIPLDIPLVVGSANCLAHLRHLRFAIPST